MGEEIDPEEENLRVIYDSILDFYEVHNTEKLDDEDSLAKVKGKIQRYNQEREGSISWGLIARKKKVKGGWAYPSNHDRYQDPFKVKREDTTLDILKPSNDGKKLPPPSSVPPQSSQKQKAPSKAGPRQNREASHQEGTKLAHSKNNQKSKNSQVGGRSLDQGRRGDQRISKKPANSLSQKGANRQSQAKRNNNALRKSKHYKSTKGASGERQSQRVNSTRRGGGAKKGRPRKPKLRTFSSIEDFDNPADVQLTIKVLLEAFYGKHNRVLVTSASGVNHLVKWIETHSIEDYDKLVKKKYGASIRDKVTEKDAVRRKNLENAITDMYEYYDRTKLKKGEINQLVNKTMFDGIQHLNKEIQTHMKEEETKLKL